MTLELGIDIGQLDQVLQVGASNTVSSFLQRLGRSGRRAERPARMFFYTRETADCSHPTLGQQIPWDMLQTIAVIQLYLEEKWIEPPGQTQLPFSLLYHQTMSIVAALNELKAPDLAERVLTLDPFKHVTQEQYRAVLQHLLEIGHIEKTEINTLILGVKGAKIVDNFWFYATFQEEEMYQVREGSREIGFIQTGAEKDDYIRLAGFIWRVLEINPDKRIIFVERSRGRAETAWSGGGRPVHGRIVNRVRRVLAEDTVYPYLQGMLVPAWRSQGIGATDKTDRSIDFAFGWKPLSATALVQLAHVYDLELILRALLPVGSRVLALLSGSQNK